MEPRSRFRTSNESELRVARELIEQGYEVLKRGWPDFLAIRGDEVRFIEVKPPGEHFLSPAQYRVAHVLARIGLTVELACGSLDAVAPVALPQSAPDAPGANGQSAPDLRVSVSGIASRVGDLEQPSKPKYPAEFLEFWSQYPLKRDKRKAYRAWERARKRTTNAALIAGAIRYANDPNRVPQFTKYAEGWLNGDGWEDEPLPPRGGGSAKGDPGRLLAIADKLEAR